MYSSKAFSHAIRFLFVVVLLMIMATTLLQVFDMFGHNPMMPSAGGQLRVILNDGMRIIGILAFWLAVLIYTKDVLSSLVAGVIAVAMIYLYNPVSSFRLLQDQAESLQYYIFQLSYILPYVIFGLLHFRKMSGIRICLVYLVFFGVGVSINSGEFQDQINRLLGIVGIDDALEIRFPTESGGYRVFHPLRILVYQSIYIWQFVVFYWVYQWIKQGTSLINHTKTYIPVSFNRLDYSIVYWGLRLLLFVSGLGVIYYIKSFQDSPLYPYYLITVAIAYCFGIFIIASIYRNFLVAHFVHMKKYPGGLFLLLNIPIVNVFAFIYSLFYFNSEIESKEMNESLIDAADLSLQDQFVQHGQNGFLKFIFILAFAFPALYTLNRIGFRVDAPNSAEAILGLISFLVSLFVLWCYLKNAVFYYPIIIISAIVFILGVAFKQASLMDAMFVTGMINMIIYFGLFHFDQLKASTVESQITPVIDPEQSI